MIKTFLPAIVALALCCASAGAASPPPPFPGVPPLNLPMALKAIEKGAYSDGHFGLAVFPNPLMMNNANTPEMQAYLDSPQTKAYMEWLQTPGAMAIAQELYKAEYARYSQQLALLSTEQIVAKCGMQAVWFGSVQAIAPKAITVLRTNSDIQDIPPDFLGNNALSVLLGTLTSDQLRQLAAQGLSANDFDARQRALLKVALPSPFTIVPVGAKQFIWTMRMQSTTGAERDALAAKENAISEVYRKQVETVPPSDLAQLKLHAYFTGQFEIGDHYYSVNDGPLELTSTGAYRLDNQAAATDQNGGKDVFCGLVPNTPKPVDLQWDTPPFRQLVDTGNVKTVDELVKRVATATGLEMHADARLAANRLVVVGDSRHPQPAGDVLQALDLCMGAAWRKVGPAYILTDDVDGLAVRQQTIKDTLKRWSVRLDKSFKRTDAMMADRHWEQFFQFAPGDPAAISPEQIAGHIDPKDYSLSVALKWSELPEHLRVALQNNARKRLADDPANETGNAAAMAAVKPDTKVKVRLNVRFALELPKTGSMMWTECDLRVPEEPRPVSSVQTKPAQTLTEPVRGLLCPVSSTDELRAALDRMPAMGMNALFLDVFYNGRTFFENGAIPPSSPDAGKVLETAIAEGAKRHIAVYVVVDTFCWRKDGGRDHPLPLPDGFEEDLTARGEPPAQVVQREIASDAVPTELFHDLVRAQEGSQGWVSPFDAHVKQTLGDLVATLAQTRGLAGIAFQDNLPPGYGGAQDWSASEYGIGLGYSLANRLSYIRAHDVDPIDIGFGEQIAMDGGVHNLSKSFDIRLPEFPQWVSGIDDWSPVRTAAVKETLQTCYAAVKQTNPALRVYESSGNALRPWNDPDQIVDEVAISSPDWDAAIDKQVLLLDDVRPNQRTNNDSVLWWLDYTRNRIGKMRQGGIVVNLSIGATEQDLIKTLDHIAPCFTVPDAARKPGAPSAANTHTP